VNAAHSIRKGEWDSAARRHDAGTFDLVVVGADFPVLMAADTFNKEGKGNLRAARQSSDLRRGKQNEFSIDRLPPDRAAGVETGSPGRTARV